MANIDGRMEIVASESGLTINTLISAPISASLNLNADCVTQAFFIADRPYRILGIRESHRVAGTDGGAVTLQITKDASGTVAGAGTDLLTTGINLKSAVGTPVSGVLITNEATLTLAASDRLSFKFAGTTTALAGVVISVSIRLV